MLRSGERFRMDSSRFPSIISQGNDFNISIILLSSGPSVRKSPHIKYLEIFLSLRYDNALFNK